MSSSIVELIAGNGIIIDANKTNDTIILSSTGGLSTEELNKIKNLEEYIRRISLLSNNGLVIDKSGIYKIPITGKYEIRLCGGGGSGGGAWSTITKYSSFYQINMMTGCGGNSSYLMTREFDLIKDTEIAIIIGAAGKFNEITHSGNDGSDTRITIDGGVNYVAKGGNTNKIVPSTMSYTTWDIFIPEEEYDGYNGSVRGGCGFNSDTGSSTILNVNGNNGIQPGGITRNNMKDKPLGFDIALGGGGGGGVIAGNIKAGRGFTNSPASGYGAGGGGAVAQHKGVAYKDDPYAINFLPGGDGAQGAVQIKYLGNE